MTQPPKRRWLALLPIALFIALAAIFLIGLGNDDPGRIPSALIGKPAPERQLPGLAGMENNGNPIPGLEKTTLGDGRVSLVNIWASWCGPCRQEHPLLMDLAERDDIRLIGINYKDKPENAKRFLGSLGNPYDVIAVDKNGRAGVDWGVYGVPETFLIDGKGVIRHKWIGPLTPAIVKQELLPKLQAVAN